MPEISTAIARDWTAFCAAAATLETTPIDRPDLAGTMTALAERIAATTPTGEADDMAIRARLVLFYLPDDVSVGIPGRLLQAVAGMADVPSPDAPPPVDTLERAELREHCRRLGHSWSSIRVGPGGVSAMSDADVHAAVLHGRKR